MALTATLGGELIAIANPLVPEEQLTQTPSRLCRRVFEPRGLVVHVRPTPNSPTVGGVPYRSQVTITPDSKGIRGPGGRTWVKITKPLSGFVSNGYPEGRSNLISCSATIPDQPINPTSNLCRRLNPLATPDGLVIRARPTRFSPKRGGVAVKQELYLVEGYERIPDWEGEPRNWVEIVAPVPGFVSGDALIPCSSGTD